MNVCVCVCVCVCECVCVRENVCVRVCVCVPWALFPSLFHLPLHDRCVRTTTHTHTHTHTQVVTHAPAQLLDAADEVLRVEEVVAQADVEAAGGGAQHCGAGHDTEWVRHRLCRACSD